MKWSFLGEFTLFHRVKKFYFRPGKEQRFRNEDASPFPFHSLSTKFINRLAMAKHIYIPLSPILPYKSSSKPLQMHRLPSGNSRHRGDTYTPPRWRFSFTAVTLSRHRGESYFSKARSEKNPLDLLPTLSIKKQQGCKIFRFRHRCSAHDALCHRQPIYELLSPDIAL